MKNLLSSLLPLIPRGSIYLSNAEPVHVINPSRQLALGILSLPCNLELQLGCCVHRAFYMGFRDLNSGPLSFIASYLTSEPHL